MYTHANVGITGKEVLALASLEEMQHENSYCQLDDNGRGGFFAKVEWIEMGKSAAGLTTVRYESRYSYTQEKGLRKVA